MAKQKNYYTFPFMRVQYIMKVSSGNISFNSFYKTTFVKASPTTYFTVLSVILKNLIEVFNIFYSSK